MELLADFSFLSVWLLDYGSLTLFILLSLGIVALPIPEETLMVLAGVWIHQGKLAMPATFFSAYAGSILGISLSYLLGRSAGRFLLHKYGKWFGLTQERFEKVLSWFEKWGKWLLVVGYFIPGVRHFTGFSAGTAQMPYTQFALFAYCGAILWTSLFLVIGYYLGPYCLSFFNELESIDIIIGLIAFLGVVAIVFGTKKYYKNTIFRKWY